jgi:hypothetical protein
VRRAIAWACLLLVIPVGLASAAEAPGPTFVRFAYERGEAVGACPDQAAIQLGVAARLGYDPFRPDATFRLRASIERGAGALEARIEMIDGQGRLTAERRLQSRQRDCAELASSVELAISIAIDPLGQGRARGVAAMAPARSPESSVAPAESQAPPPVESAHAASPAQDAATAPPLVSRFVLAAVGALRVAPSPNLGVVAGASVGRRWWSLALEARADWPASTSLRAGEVSSAIYVGTLVPCVHHGVVAVCALASAGAQRVAGNGLVQARSAIDAYAAVGGRLGADLPLSGHFALTLHGDVSAPLTPMHLQVDGGTVWTSPALAVALGLGLAAIFP